MSADYPASITALFSDVSDGQIVDISHINRMKEEIIAMQAELGVDVSDRLGSLDIGSRDNHAPMAEGDYFSVYDTSEATTKRLAYSNLAPDAEYKNFTWHSSKGSTDTVIMRMDTTPTINIDSSNAWSITSTAANGWVMTINIAGIYYIQGNYGNDGGPIGMTLNSSELTTNIQSLTYAINRVSFFDTNAANVRGDVECLRRFSIGDKIRFHGSGTTPVTEGWIYAKRIL